MLLSGQIYTLWIASAHSRHTIPNQNHIKALSDSDAVSFAMQTLVLDGMSAKEWEPRWQADGSLVPLPGTIASSKQRTVVLRARTMPSRAVTVVLTNEHVITFSRFLK